MRQRSSAKRAQRKFRMAGREVEMNVVSLIDIFAILVFYLLVNALAVEVLPSPNSLQLPKSIVKEEPKQTPVIVVSKNDILVDNVRVMSTSDASATDSTFLPDLKAELLRAPLLRVDGGDATSVTRGDVNIMADKAIPYEVLKKVMATCTEARFAKISLAVIEKHGGTP
ncbi:ExbD/TolR family protein [Solimonas terrae]|uniref:Biopolymer transporter ExbD n=1 Tax=Solimonas terrae TaxID=1396819 RepID=A0A6M2BNS9_9GAMM|nr:biopolymer transporter ExbD [Solimonas terrae]NGY03719.1 biopolymer transporter ExbD [Solimonas terrae]